MNRPAITRADFEALAARLVEALPRVDSADSLVQCAAWLLEGDRAILLRASGDPPQLTTVAGWPTSAQAPSAEAVLAALDWRDGAPGLACFGYPLEKPTSQVLSLGVTDALLAFPSAAVAREGKHQLLVLRTKPSGSRYSTYHCTVASSLLAHFVHLEAIRTERRTRTEYARLLSLEVIPKIAWSEFQDGLQRNNSEKANDPEFMGPAAVLWLGYRKRPDVPGPDADRPSRPAPPFATLYDFLSRDGFADPQVATAAIEACRCSQGSQGCQDARKAALMVLEHGWRRVYRAVCNESDNNTRLPTGPDCQALLDVTSVLAIDALGSRPAQDHRDSSELGREALRLYLATLVACAGPLRHRCLGIGLQNEDPKQPTPEVRQEMLVNLARFMLSVVEILERQIGIAMESRAVSHVEALEGLLYVIDRYVHVELGVDERLHVRERLARGFGAEIHRHLVHHFYRDHLLHVVDVFLLGHLLLTTQFTDQNSRKCKLVDHMPRPAGEPNTADDIHKHHLRDWAVAALFHDIGYQIDPDEDALDDPKVIQSFFALSRPCPRKGLDPRGTEGAPCCREWVKALADELAGAPAKDSWLPDLRSHRLKDHGILSALRVAQLLAHGDAEGSPWADPQPYPSLAEYRAALHAIAHHNLFGCAVHFSKEPLSCLLRLCDEVQEWGRRRVNIERLVKHLYLEIEEAGGEDLCSSEDLVSVRANVVFKHKPEQISEVDISVPAQDNMLQFWLSYRSPVEAHFDAITTFLSKAYNLEHVDLASTAPPVCAQWRVILCFPRPPEYRGLTELGIYSILRERIRGLPELERRQFSSLPAGLSVLADLNDDCFAIVVKGGLGERSGRQTCDPGGLREQIVAIKQQMLTGRLVDPDSRRVLRP